jgi:hypothetical protein
MEHFYQTIPGWCDFENIYHGIVQTLPDNSHIVEVGSWKGRSAAFMCVEIANSGKNIRFDCVDTWKGSLVEQEHQADPSVVNDTLYEDFLNYMSPAKGIFTPVRAPSVMASSAYDNNSLDFVFIDAGHTYEDAHADITAWLPKVKSGAILAGHDYFSAPGVKKAVDELLGNVATDQSSWIYKKP